MKVCQLEQLTANDLKESIAWHPIVLCQNHHINNHADFIEFAQRLGKLMSWEFGVINELKVNPEIDNYLYTNEEVPYHWDGAFAQSPHLLLFLCLAAPEPTAGGRTIFHDTQRMTDTLTSRELELFQQVVFEYITQKNAHYGGQFQAAAIQKHPVTQQMIIRFAQEVNTKHNPVVRQLFSGDSAVAEQFMKWLEQQIASEQFTYQHTWHKGDLLIADNHRLLHGREAFAKTTSRHILRIQVEYLS